MHIMWKLDRELPFGTDLLTLLRVVRRAKYEATCFPRGGAQMTDGADRRAGPDHGLTGEELGSVTANTGFVIGKVSYIGESPLAAPLSWNLMASIAGEGLVFVRRMQKLR